MSEDNIQAAIDAGKLLAGAPARITVIPHPSNPENVVPVALVERTDGDTAIELLADVLATLDVREPLARRRDNCARLAEVESLIAYVKRYGSERTIAYASAATFTFVAVLDDHPQGGAGTAQDLAGWRAHRAIYECPRSPEWLAWSAKDGKAMRQTEFADFLESRLEDLVSVEGMPKPIEMLGTARMLNIKTKGQIQREINPTTGDYLMVSKSETTSDSTPIPRAFAIGVPVFEGGERYQVECRIRFAIQDGAPTFSYVMHRRPEIERDAFNAVRTKIGTETGRLILAGTP